MTELEILQQGSSVVLKELGARQIALYGTVVPTAGAGVEAPVRSKYYKMNGANVESNWTKTGVANTAWTQDGVGSGGGGGPAVKAVWDITPTYTPAATNPATLVNPFFIQNNANVLTTQLVAQSTNSEQYKFAGIFADSVIDFLNDDVKSHRIRLTLNNVSLGQQEDVLVFGLVESAMANQTDLTTLLSDLFNNNTLSSSLFVLGSAFRAIGGTTLQGRLFGASDGASSVGSFGGLSPTNGTVDNLDIYITRFDMGVMSAPAAGNFSFATTVSLNGIGAATFATADAEVSLQTKTLVPFVAIGAMDTLAAGIENEVTVTVDFNGASDTVTQTIVGYPLSQMQYDTLFNNPVQPYGTHTPASYTQAALPVGAAVGEIFRAYVNPAYTHHENTVRPFGTFVLDGELVHMVNVTNGSEAIGIVDMIRENTLNTTPSIVYGGVLDANIYGDGSYSSMPDVLLATEQKDFMLRFYGDSTLVKPAKLASLDLIYRYGSRNRRFEVMNRTLKDSVVSVHTATRQINAFDGTVDPISTSRKIIYINDFELPFGYNGVEYDFSNYKRFKLFSDKFPDNTNVMGVYYELTLDNPLIGYPTGSSLPYLYNNGAYGANITVAANDEVTPVVYLKITDLTSSIVRKPDLANSWGGATVTAVKMVVAVDQFPLQTVTAGNTENLAIYPLEPSYFVTQGFSPVRYGFEPTDIADNILVDEALARKINELQPHLIGTSPLFGIYLTASGDGNGQAFNIDTEKQPFNNKSFTFTYGKYVNSSIVAYKFATIYPVMHSGYPIKPNTKIAVDLTANDIILRWINTVDDEVSFSLSLLDTITNNSSNRVVKSNSIGSLITGLNNISNISGMQLQPSYTNVYLGWRPAATHEGIPGINAVEPIEYIRGDDYVITATNQIDFLTTPPTTPGSFSLQYDTGNIGVDFSATPTYTVANLLSDLQAGNMNCSSYLSLGAETIDISFKNYDRPNPAVIDGFAIDRATYSASLGELFTVDEFFDPSLNLEMKHQVTNALARVIKTGVFNNRRFIEGNFARWDGALQTTVPFPNIPEMDYDTLPFFTDLVVFVDPTFTNNDNVTKFRAFSSALARVVANNNIGTIIVSGQNNVAATTIYKDNALLWDTAQISIIGINNAELIFETPDDDNLTTLGMESYFFNFRPYLSNIKITYHTQSINHAFKSVFRQDQRPWVIGDNVHFKSDNTLVPTGTHNVVVDFLGTNNAKLIAGDLKLSNTYSFTTPNDVRAAIRCSGSLTIEANSIEYVSNKENCISADEDNVNTNYAETGSINIVVKEPTYVNSTLFQTRFITERMKELHKKTFINSAAFNPLYNSTHRVDTQASTVICTIDKPAIEGDRILFIDASNSFDTNAFTVTPIDSAVKINGLSDPVTFNVKGCWIEFVYTGDPAVGWTYQIHQDALYTHTRRKKAVTSPYTLTAGDIGFTLIFDDTNPCTINVPSQTVVDFPEGYRVFSRNKNATPGQITYSVDAGDSLSGEGATTANASHVSEIYLETKVPGAVGSVWVTVDM